VSEATICRAVGSLRRSRKKDPEGQQNETSSLEEPMAHGGRTCRSWTLGVLKDEMGTHTSLAPVYAYDAPVGERAFFKIPRNRGLRTPRSLRAFTKEGDGSFYGRGRSYPTS
jgi:hypothetical protein